MASFVKLMRSEQAAFLDHHPNANHLLNVIARRARRTKCHLNQLEVGECFISFRSVGMTEQQYRTAKKQLQKWVLVEFKKGRRVTDKGTVALLLNSSIYDINITEGNGSLTEEQRKANGKLTTNKECNKEKNEIIKDLPDIGIAIPISEELKNESFKKFWDLYNKKNGSAKCKTKWNKLKQVDIEKVFIVLPGYISATPDKQFRKDPLTWLNGEHWNDDIQNATQNDRTPPRGFSQ